MDIKILKSQLKQPYQRSQWKSLLPTIFGQQVSIDTKAEKIDLATNKAKSLERFASISLIDNKNIAVLDVETSDNIQIERNRIALRDMAYRLIDQDKYHGLLVFYFNKGNGNKEAYRMSFVSKETTIDESGVVIEKSTHPRRYTYILGAGENRTTTAQRLLELKTKLSSSKNANKGIALKDVTNAFSVSNLTKEFYNELFRWYQWALSEEVGITYPKNPNITEDDREKLEEQIIRLITRLLFVWFIKQKHLIPNNLFDIAELKNVLKGFDHESTVEGNYYNAILQNLFFATLNKAIDERAFAKTKTIRDIKTLYRYVEMFNISEDEILQLFKPIPFLNGGLFECLDKEDAEGNKYFLDGFSRNDKKSANGNFKHRAFIPNCVFFDEEKGIIPLLQRYNFTVEEHSPDDVQVALDPELLGNVFENLLGAFNNETKESARKKSGSFYTPREVVNYMVSESLIAYLQNVCPELERNAIRYLLEKEELPDTFKNNERLCTEIAAKLKSVKIIDPACGSGAFPMGILKKMVAVLEKLDIHDNETAYQQKLHLIEECIYGVDIQTIAVQISKLRFFISLIVEQEKDKNKPNYGITPLPNLETKFVAADALIGVKKKKKGDFVANLFENPRINEVKNEILKVRHDHFYADTAYAKKQLREKDEKLRDELAKLLQENNDFAPEDAKQLAKWNPYNQNEAADFFDVEWMFGLKNGFDIVIGNPPYIQLQHDNGKLAKKYQNGEFKTFARTGDIYSLFYEKGWQLLKRHGALCYITSNKWMRAGYGESTRKFFAENTNPVLLIDFAGQKIFDAATVDTNILLFTKDKNRQQTQACVVNEKVLNNLSVYFRQQATICHFSKRESWVVLSEIEQRIKAKIEAVGVPLKDWDINIYRGILTGYNEAFIINGEKKDELIAEDPKSAEIIRPILRGRDIKRYGYDNADKWLIFIPWHFPFHKDRSISGSSELAENEFKNQYPAIYNHLLSYKSELSNRNKEETGKRYEWYALQRWGANYWEDFFRPKIVYPNMTKFMPFVYDNMNFITNQKCFIITGECIEFLTAFLNSSLFKM